MKKRSGNRTRGNRFYSEYELCPGVGRRGLLDQCLNSSGLYSSGFVKGSGGSGRIYDSFQKHV
jgi:hypothetical protein